MKMLKDISQIPYRELLRVCRSEVINERVTKYGENVPHIHIGHVLAQFVLNYRKDFFLAHDIDRKKTKRGSTVHRWFLHETNEFVRFMQYNSSVVVPWDKYHDSVEISEDDLYSFLFELIG